MAKILVKERLSENVWRYRINASRIASKRQAGQFIILRPNSHSERIPLTISNADADSGWIEVIFQVVGQTTMELSSLYVGDEILDIAGPLGKPTHIKKYGRCLCVGGGVGIAPLFPIICALNSVGNNVTSILGARSQNLLILEKEIEKQSEHLWVATDDGSYGRKGFVSDIFNEISLQGEHFDIAFVIGPPIMMKVTSSLIVKAGIDTFVSLNPIMIDGTGMCGGCRVIVDGQTKFACVDGPEFRASALDWDSLIKRLGSYRSFEIESKEKHQCRLKGGK